MKQNILSTIIDLCSGFIYYDRIEDSTLPEGRIEQAVKDGEITIDEMVDEFRKQLEESINK